MRLLFLFVLALSGEALAQGADPAPLSYQKADTRQETLEATLAASDLPVLGPWSQVGPFDPYLRRVVEPQNNPADNATYECFGGAKGTWALAPECLDGYANAIRTDGFDQAMLNKQPTICLRRTITVKQPTRLRVFLGADGGLFLTLGGKPVFYSDTIRDLAAGQEEVVLPLEPGDNVLVMKIKLMKVPTRFFFLPDFGQGVTESLVARLERDFPAGELLDGYRDRARAMSTRQEDEYYRLAEIEVPPGIVLEGGGMDFTPEGRLAVSTRRGYVYLVENPGSDDPQKIHFHRFAAGLHEGLGLKVVDGRILVVTRGELTRLVDSDEDGEADRFENVSNEWGLSGFYHEYAYGLETDAAKNLYIPLNLAMRDEIPVARYRGWVVRITPRGELEPFCFGLRSPNGIGANAEGDLFVTDNQGEWMPACPLYHIRQDHFYGHPDGSRWASSPAAVAAAQGPRTPPVVWLPYDELSQSATDVVCDRTGGKFGPFGDQLFIGDMTKGTIVRVQLEKVGGQYQGACFLFRRGCGAVNRMTFGPEGKLYVSRANRGWGGGGMGEGLARLEFTGRMPLEIERVHLLADGFELHFTLPLAPGEGIAAEGCTLEQYRYHNWKNYGSPKIDREAIEVHEVKVSADRRSLRLKTGPLEAGKMCHIKLPRLESAGGELLLHDEAFYNINQLVR